jgi:hypothetical protein
MKLVDRAPLAPAGAGETARQLWLRGSCALWGHFVDNHALAQGPPGRTCRCGTPYLTRDGAVTRVRHTLSCFLGHHEYVPLADRHGSREYVCAQCGHPLVLADEADPFRGRARFAKRVRYLCGLLGHRVRTVTRRDGLVEYACHCGHTFLKDTAGAAVIRHPMVCVTLGHYVRFVTVRGDYDEFVCVNCGHPFCFARSRSTAWSSDSPR